MHDLCKVAARPYVTNHDGVAPLVGHGKAPLNLLQNIGPFLRIVQEHIPFPNLCSQLQGSLGGGSGGGGAGVQEEDALLLADLYYLAHLYL